MAITTTSNLSTDIAAHQQIMYYALRSELFFDTIADVGSTDVTNRGASVTFYFTNDLAAATTPLTETSDVTPATVTDSTLTLTLAEYGNAVQTTALVRATSFLDVNTTMANVLGYNAGISVDTLAVTALAAGTQAIWSTGTSFAATGTEAANNRLATTDNFNGNMVRYAAARLRAQNVMPFADGLYRGFIHPDTAYDFKGSTGGTNWSDPHIYSSPEGIWNGTIGAFQGVRWMETPRAPITSDVGDGVGGAGTIDAYASFVVGRQALAKAFSMGPGGGGEYGAQPMLVESPVIDLLRRFRGMGWKHLVKYGIFRQAAVMRLMTASSIGANT
jgi:N4-gp56 family major capsid protein